MEIVEHCTAAEHSQCIKCTFWHALTESGDACKTHIVWLVILLAVVGGLILLAIIVAGVLAASHAFLAAKHRRDLARTICVFAIDQSNVQFVETNRSGAVASTQCVVLGDVRSPLTPRQGRVCVTETLGGDDSM